VKTEKMISTVNDEKNLFAYIRTTLQLLHQLLHQVSNNIL